MENEFNKTEKPLVFSEDFDMSPFVSKEEEVDDDTNPTDKVDNKIDDKEKSSLDNKIDDKSSSDSKEEKPEKEEVATTDEKDKENLQSGKGEDDLNSSPGVLYSSLASTLREQGILSSLDPEKDKIESVDDLLEVFNKELTARELADLNETQKTYLTALRKGIPEEEVKAHLKVTDTLTSITEDEIKSNDKLRKSLLIEQNKLLYNMDDVKAEKYADRVIAAQEDTEEALSALTALKDYSQKEFEKKQSELEQSKLAQVEAQKKSIEDIKNFIDTNDSIIKGDNLSKTEKNKLFEQMTKAVGTHNGQPIDAVKQAQIKDPKDFAIKLHYLFLVTDGFKDLNRFVKKGKNEATSKLDQIIRSQANAFGGNGGGNEMENNDAIASDFSNLGKIV